MDYIVPLNDLSRQAEIDTEEIGFRLLNTLRSGVYFNGVETEQLRDSMRAIFPGRDFIPVSNGTDALILALESLLLSPQTMVAVAPNAGGYGTVAALRAGLQPVFIDVNPTTLQMCAQSLLANLDQFPGIGTVIVTHLYGQVGEIETIRDICNSRGIYLIEDCAQSFGASVNGQPAGTFGDLATLSFYPTKNLGAAGDGGGVIARDPVLVSRAQKLAQYGWNERYVVTEMRGFNSRMDEVQACIINYHLKNLEIWNDRRRNIVSRYSQALSPIKRMVGDCTSSSFVAHLAILITDNRDSVREILANAGVQTSIHYPVLDPDQPAWRGIFSETDLFVSRRSNQSIVTLPCFPLMTDDEIKFVCSALSELGDNQ